MTVCRAPTGYGQLADKVCGWSSVVAAGAWLRMGPANSRVLRMDYTAAKYDNSTSKVPQVWRATPNRLQVLVYF